MRINPSCGNNLLCICEMCVAVEEILQSKTVVQLFYLKDFTNASSVHCLRLCMTTRVQQQVFLILQHQQGCNMCCGNIRIKLHLMVVSRLAGGARHMFCSLLMSANTNMNDEVFVFVMMSYMFYNCQS
jgi:hypothetical protein